MEKLLSNAHVFPITLFKLDTFSTLHKNWARLVMSFSSAAFKYFFLASLLGAMSFWAASCRQSQPVMNLASTDVDISPDAININTATAEELERLPHVGGTLAQKIVEFRAVNGPFRRPEHLLLVDGISEKRFQQIRSLIKIE